MKGCILVNAYLNSKEYLYQAERIRDELIALDSAADIVSLGGMPVVVADGRIENALDGYDFYICWDKDKYVLSALERTSKRVFNSAAAIEACDDKMLTYLALANSGVPLVRTVPGLLCFDPSEKIAPETIGRLESLIPYPIVVKESYGSLGKGVRLAKNRDELIAITEQVKCKPHLFQEFIDESRGRDLRVIVLGGKVLGGMLRDSGGKDFRSNIGAGGSGTACTPDEEQSAVAIKTAGILGLDYCGVDLLLGKNGPIVCEVNSNAFFYSFERVTGVNVAKAYARYVLDETAKRQRGK